MRAMEFNAPLVVVHRSRSGNRGRGVAPMEICLKGKSHFTKAIYRPVDTRERAPASMINRHLFKACQ